MIILEIGVIRYVIGNSRAMVAAGPRPGKTPTSVPNRTPKKQVKRFTGSKRVPKPRIIFCQKSITIFLLGILLVIETGTILQIIKIRWW
jgi:hypothetical protein